MRIDDDELRDLFRDESDEHLQSLEQGLLKLEGDPQDQTTLDETYRAAHSLKGASAMIGVSKVETVIHRFEDVLGTARRGTVVLTSDAIDRLYQALGSVRQFCQEAVTGKLPSVELDQILQTLAGQVSVPVTHTQTRPDSREPALREEVTSEESPVEEPVPPSANEEPTPPTHPDEPTAPDEPQTQAWHESKHTATPEALGEPSVTYIEDEELRDLFKVETTEQIEQLEHGLLRLEQNPKDQETLDEVFRAAHSLKGAARMLAISRVETVAHHFEETLGLARRGTTELTSTTVDRLYQALDSIRELCDESITGQPAMMDLETVLKRMVGDADTVDSTAKPKPRSEPTIVSTPPPDPSTEIAAANQATDTDQSTREIAPAPQPGPSEIAPPPTPKAAPSEIAPLKQAGTIVVPAETPAYNIDTIRVPSTKLDNLMSHAGELSVTRGRIALRVAQVEQLLGLWEQWNRDSHKVRSLAESCDVEINERGIQQMREYMQSDRQQLDQLGTLLKQLESAVQGDDTRVDMLASQLEDGIRSIRLLPLSTVFNLFPRLVRDLARSQEKDVQFLTEGGATAADKRILEELKDPLTHMIRNAIDHGIESPQTREQSGKPAQATLRLRAYQHGPNVVIEIKDDGGGIDPEVVKQTALKRKVATGDELDEMTETQIQALIFAPGFSTKAMVTDVSGRGVGMDVVRANVEKLRGTIEIDSTLGKGTVFRLVLPVTVATRRVLIVAVDDFKFAIPVEHVQTSLLINREDVFPMQGRGTITLDGDPVSVVRLSGLLELPQQDEKTPEQQADSVAEYLECIVIRSEGERYGFIVDELLDEQEVVLKPHGAILRRVRNVAGSTILQTGEVCVTLNPQDLLRSARGRPGAARLETTLPTAPRKIVILLAEDSIVTRTQEKRMLEGAGFEVITAVDGQDAFDKLGTCEIDAVVSDVEMPNLTGLELTAKIRQQPKYKDLPIILVTSLATNEDRKRGMEVGADAYLTKPQFDQTMFLETVRRFA